MSYVETLQMERKVRLARIASKAKPEGQPIRLKAIVLPPEARHVRLESKPSEDAEYEASWYLAIVGCEDFIAVTPRKFRIEEIQGVVALHFGLAREDILIETRKPSITRPRQIAIYLTRHFTNRSLPEIAKYFGAIDHTTALHAVRKIEALMRTDIKLADNVRHLWNQLMVRP